MRWTLSLVLLTSCMPMMSKSSESDLDRARRVLASTPLIDGHNDLPWAIRESKTAPRDVDAYDLRHRTAGHTDLERLHEGMVGGQFWSVYIPGEIADSGFARVQMEQIDIARRVVEKYPETFVWALTAADLRRAHREGKIGSVLGLEGGHAIENIARHTARVLRSRRALHDAHPQCHHGVGGCRARLGEARRTHAVREGSRARDESHGNAGRSGARFAGHDERRARRHRGAGDLLAFGRARDGGSSPKRPGFDSQASAGQWRRGDGALRHCFRVTRGRRVRAR